MITIDKLKIKEIPKIPTAGQAPVTPSNFTSDESSFDSSDYEESKDSVHQMEEIRSRMTVQVGDFDSPVKKKKRRTLQKAATDEDVK